LPFFSPSPTGLAAEVGGSGHLTYGPEDRRPSRQIGTAHFSLFTSNSITAPSKRDLESAVAGLLEVREETPSASVPSTTLLS
jgi:hypothetical protein